MRFDATSADSTKLHHVHKSMSSSSCAESDGVEEDLSPGSECVEHSSTEKLTSPHEDGIHLFLHRAQKTVEYGFLRCRCCCQDSVECSVPQPYEGLESAEAQGEDATPGTDATHTSEQRTQSLGTQSGSNGSPQASDFVLTGEVPEETAGASDPTTTLDSIAEEKKSSTSATDKRISWKKTRAFFRRVRKAMKLPLLCGGVDVVEPFGPSPDSTQKLNLHEPSNVTLSGSESIPVPGEVLFQPTNPSGMEASLLEIGSAKTPTECVKKKRIGNYLKKAWKGWK